MKWVWNFKRGMITSESGYVLIISLFVMVIVSIVGIGLVVVGINEFNLSTRTKLMDRAYAIAEAGINRATVQLRLDTTLTTGLPGTDHLYMVPGCTPQWPSGVLAGVTESFGGGSYNVTLWQSERTTPHDERSLAQYKVIRSTGTVSRGNLTAERTIEARIAAGATSSEYDASFDYCIYNGFNSTAEADRTWPSQQELQWNGHIVFDGYSPYEGRYPKGAIYTKGNIIVPVAFNGHLNVKGNIVATNSIKMQNAWSAGFADVGIEVTKGNVVAGLNRDHAAFDDNTANADPDMKFGEVNIGNNNLHFSTTATGGSQSAIAVYSDGAGANKGYLVAAKDVTANASAVLSSAAPLRIGVNTSDNADGGILAGRDVEVIGFISLFGLNELRVGSVTSGRSTYVGGGFAKVRLNTISAGQNEGWDYRPVIDQYGAGVCLETGGIPLIAPGEVKVDGQIISRGKVYGGALVGRMDLGNIRAGNDVPGNGTGGVGLDLRALLAIFTTGNIERVGSLNKWEIWPFNISTGSVTVIPSKPAAPTVDVLAAAGLTSPVNLIEPQWSYFEGQAMQDDLVNGPNIKKCPNCGRSVEGDGGLPPVFPNNCPTCSAVLTGVYPGPAHIVWDRTVGDPVGTGGDYGDADDHKVTLHWDSTLPYSSKETVYNGDPDTVITIKKMNWTEHNNEVFEGTIVSKGDVSIDAPDATSDWFIGSKNILNICSGRDITRSTGGPLKVWTSADSQFHFWAKGDINLTNLQYSFGTTSTFFGSFTAGDQVICTNNSFYKDLTFKWSRWPLPAEAWVEPVKILSWKEI